MSDYVGSASNCVGDMSRTMPADSLLTLYSVYSVNSLLSLTSCYDNPRETDPQTCVSRLCSPRSSCGRSSRSVWRPFSQPSTWKPSASVRSSEAQLVQRARMGNARRIFYFFSPCQTENTTTHKCTTSPGSVRYHIIPLHPWWLSQK